MSSFNDESLPYVTLALKVVDPDDAAEDAIFLRCMSMVRRSLSDGLVVSDNVQMFPRVHRACL